jgi:hypothetical protein
MEARVSITKMYVVALTRRSATPIEADAAALAPVLGRSAYEARLALAAPPPAVLLETPDVDAARSLLALLRQRGHGAVACDTASVTPSENMITPRNFRFDEMCLIADEQPGIEYAAVAALLRATHARRQENTSERTEKKLSLARSALTGGVVNTKSVTVTERSVVHEREQVLYVMNRSGSGHVILRETRLRYAGLGTQIGMSTTENFGSVVNLMRERAPSALFDDRLLKTRHAGTVRQSGAAAARTITSSNDVEVDLAAHLLTVAFLQGQL